MNHAAFSTAKALICFVKGRRRTVILDENRAIVTSAPRNGGGCSEMIPHCDDRERPTRGGGTSYAGGRLGARSRGVEKPAVTSWRMAAQWDVVPSSRRGRGLQ
jgi:hypothetical protein